MGQVEVGGAGNLRVPRDAVTWGRPGFNHRGPGLPDPEAEPT